MTVSVTIDDVAIKAGVSIKTVSRVLNREPNVSEKTLAKVQEAIKALNYRPNNAARGLAGRRSFLVGLLYDNASVNYLAKLQTGVLTLCEETGYGLALCPATFGDDGLIDHVTMWLRQTQVDGVVITPPLSDSKALLRAIMSSNVPAVIVSSKGPGDMPAVIIDEAKAAWDMTQHLIHAGHTKIGFIKGHPDHSSSEERYRGFQDCLIHNGLEHNGEWVKQGYFDFESGVSAGQELLSLNKPPTAIFASNDDMAAGVLHVAHRLNILIPETMAVVGFDDTSLSRQIWPSLTTVQQPIRLMGTRALELLLEIIAQKGDVVVPSNTVHQMDFQLMVRESSQCSN